MHWPFIADVQQDGCQLTAMRAAAHFYNFFTKPPTLPNFSNTMIWPGGVPLFDHLAGLAQGLDAWPPLNPAFFLPLWEQRVVNSRACGSVQVRELTIGSTPQFEVEEVGRWFADKINQRRSNNFVGWVPMLFHTIKTMRAVMARDPHQHGEGRHVRTHTGSHRRLAQVLPGSLPQ